MTALLNGNGGMIYYGFNKLNADKYEVSGQLFDRNGQVEILKTLFVDLVENIHPH